MLYVVIRHTNDYTRSPHRRSRLKWATLLVL